MPYRSAHSPPGSIYLKWEDHDGIVEIVPTRRQVVTVHINRKDSKASGAHMLRAAFAWCQRNLGTRKVVAFIPTINKPAQHAAAQAGMTREGYSPSAFFENGPAEDLVYYGVTLCQ